MTQKKVWIVYKSGNKTDSILTGKSSGSSLSQLFIPNMKNGFKKGKDQ